MFRILYIIYKISYLEESSPPTKKWKKQTLSLHYTHTSPLYYEYYHYTTTIRCRFLVVLFKKRKIVKNIIKTHVTGFETLLDFLEWIFSKIKSILKYNK